MKVSLSWLDRHLTRSVDLKALADKLTAIGLEVENITDRAKELAPFIVGHVVSAERHPNADKLQVCRVDTGREVLQVVCGAPNARLGLKGVFAPVGSIIPGTGLELKKGVIRGVDSYGMLCSAREMGLPDDTEKGIIELPPDAPIGQPFANVLGLNDPIIEINLTPNRPDCAGVYGIARDLAAADAGTLKPLPAPSVRGTFKSPVSVSLQDTSACPMFAGRFIRGVKNRPSPPWLQDKLTAVGLRPVSALVDVTNYLLLDQARPLHVFDADRLKGNIAVRFAASGEKLNALNDKSYTLDPEMIVIADDSGAISLGGIMGGQSTACTDGTVNVFVESALFDPLRIATTGRKLDIVSDSRYRFERGVDPASVRPGLDAAVQMIVELCGGEPSEMVVAGQEPDWRRTYTLRPDRCETLGGVSVPVNRQQDILASLGFTVVEEAQGFLHVTPPSWRRDILGEADLVEEILRIIGFDSIPAVPVERVAAITPPALTSVQRRAHTVRRALAAQGLCEAVTWSFMDENVATLFGKIDSSARLVNPISSDLNVLRPSLLGNLIQAARKNADRGYPHVSLFEVGPQFHSGQPGDQALVACGVRAGEAQSRHWAGGARNVDAFDAKADALVALEAAGAPAGNAQITTDAPTYYHPGRSAALRLGQTVLAYCGEIHPAILTALKCEGPVVGFEVFLDAIPAPKKKTSTAKPLADLPAFQPVRRDFAFVVEAGVAADKLVRAAMGADKALIRHAEVFDVYEGPGVPAGSKSLALAVTVQPRDKTLAEADIEALAQRIIASVAKATGASLRS